MSEKKTLQAKKPTTLEGIADRNIYQEFTLPSGKNCVIKRFKGKHVQQAQRLMDTSLGGEDFADCLASMLVEIDGRPILKEDLPEMDGVDYLKLITPINQLFT